MYSTRQVLHLIGVTIGEMDYWRKLGLANYQRVLPGSGGQWVFDFADMVSFLGIKWLLNGIPVVRNLGRFSSELSELAKRTSPPDASLFLLVDGTGSVVELDNPELAKIFGQLSTKGIAVLVQPRYLIDAVRKSARSGLPRQLLRGRGRPTKEGLL